MSSSGFSARFLAFSLAAAAFFSLLTVPKARAASEGLKKLFFMADIIPLPTLAMV
jgi:hypothetical protein